MARNQHQHPLIRSSMPATVALLVVTSILPVRYLDWVGWFGGLAATVFTPISDPLTRVSRWLAPASRAVRDDERLVALEADRDELRRRLLVAKRQVATLESRIADVEAGFSRTPEVAVKQLTRPVVGTSSDPSSGLLRVKAGRRDGITEKSTITTVAGVQLHGQVVSVDRLECIVMPITEPESGLIRGRILLDRLGERWLLCQLAPTGVGTLRGDAEFPTPTPGGPPSPDLSPGLEVVLDDPAWPESAQMLTIGIIERVEPREDQPLRSAVVVRPRDGLELRRVREVILRIPADTTGGEP